MPTTTTSPAARIFLRRLTAEGVPLERARAILHAADTLQRIAIDDCNGGPAYDRLNAQRARCVICAEREPDARTYVGISGAVRSVCAEHAAERALLDAVAGTPIVALELDGDPRGAVVKVKLPSGRGDSFGDPSFLCVPTRAY